MDEQRQAVLASCIQFWVDERKLLGVGVHQQIGQQLRVVGGIVGQKIRGQQARVSSFRPLSPKEGGEWFQKPRLDWPKRLFPIQQEERVILNKVINNQCAALCPLLALRVILG